MSVETRNGKGVIETVNTAIQRHGASRDELIPILLEVNNQLGYLPAEAFEEISRQLKEPKSQVLSVASFYSMLSTKPRGRHLVQFCESAPCHVVGGQEVWETLQNELNLKPEETSSDGKWTLITTSCIGLCAMGPVVLIDDDIYGNVEPGRVSEILARYS
jgi:NADH-quinone oxidoreductase subunit E